ncbi:hypothetical protein DAEQUDRAFT_727411, partial [Daedalea quercina L-15889]
MTNAPPSSLCKLVNRDGLLRRIANEWRRQPREIANVAVPGSAPSSFGLRDPVERIQVLG